MKIGDRIQLTATARDRFSWLVPEGTHTGEVKGFERIGVVVVQRDGVKNPDRWHRGWWEPY